MRAKAKRIIRALERSTVDSYSGFYFSHITVLMELWFQLGGRNIPMTVHTQTHTYIHSHNNFSKAVT